MKNLISSLFFFFTLGFCDAQVHVTNSTDQPITVAIVYYQSDSEFKGYISKGWWTIIPGETKVIGNFLKAGDNTYYIHAHTAGYAKTWGNEANLAVNSHDAFEIRNCDKSYVLKGENIKTVGFIKKFVHIGLFDSYAAYVNFTE